MLLYNPGFYKIAADISTNPVEIHAAWEPWNCMKKPAISWSPAFCSKINNAESPEKEYGGTNQGVNLSRA